jgi:hypothetical protein
VVDTFPGPQFSDALQGCQVQEFFLELNRKGQIFKWKNAKIKEKFSKKLYLINFEIFKCFVEILPK